MIGGVRDAAALSADRTQVVGRESERARVDAFVSAPTVVAGAEPEDRWTRPPISLRVGSTYSTSAHSGSPTFGACSPAP
jgi:hypothetical protein